MFGTWSFKFAAQIIGDLRGCSGIDHLPVDVEWFDNVGAGAENKSAAAWYRAAVGSQSLGPEAVSEHLHGTQGYLAIGDNWPPNRTSMWSIP